MKSDEEKANPPTSATEEPSTDNDHLADSSDSAVDIDVTSTLKGCGTPATDYSQSQDGKITTVSIAGDCRRQDNDDKHTLTQEDVTRDTTHSCRARLDIVVKTVTDKKDDNAEPSQPEAKPDSKDEADETGVQKESSKSLKQARAVRRAMQFPQEFESVFKDDSDTGLDSGSGPNPPGSDDPGSSSDSDDEPEGDGSSWADFVVSGVRPEDVDDESPSRLEWLRQKREEGERNECLDRLMTMIGLEQVKAHFLAVKSRVMASKTNPANPQKLRLHLVLYGKDGTGKRTIARLYAQFLYSIGAVKNDNFARVSIRSPRQRSPFMPPPPPQNTGKPKQTLPKHADVTFYDVAVRDKSSANGDPDFLSLMLGLPKRPKTPSNVINNKKMAEIMNAAKSSVLIISSRDDTLIDSIKDSEEALRELQAPLTLSDYTDDELRQILERMVQQRGLSLADKSKHESVRIVVQRVGRDRSSETFLNVHALQKELDRACKRLALRLQNEYTQWLHCSLAQGSNGDQARVLTMEDIIGPEPKFITGDNESWQKLQSMIGLENIKSECGDIIDYAQINYKCEFLGKKPLKINLNRLFLGPPGVGKTTVAKLYGQLLIDMKLVSGSKVLVKNPSDMIGAYVGHSEKMTKKLLEEAEGNVLIIDDAHMLYPGAKGGCNKTDIFRIAALDTLVANVSAGPEDRCIILAGYENEMEQLFNHNNQGLQRRFPKETALRFTTYSEDELCQIMDLKADECGLELTPDARAVARQIMGRMRINPKFGNGGDVENLLNQAKVRVNKRIRSDHASGISDLQFLLRPADFDPQWDRASKAEESRSALFKEFVGFDKIIKQFEGYQLLTAGLRLHGIDPRPHIPWAYVFKGSPGTGKTSTARKVGQLYYDMNLLSTNEVVICSVSDLIGERVGETGPKVINTLETGLGKVLFIDEAYRLAQGCTFHMEAVSEIVDAMTKPRYADNLVIILAGYTGEMEHLLHTNPGLRSRFPVHIDFPPMSPDSCVQHLSNRLQKLGITVSKPMPPSGGKMQRVHQLFEMLSRTNGWASGRDVETLAKTIISRVYMEQGRVGKVEGSSALNVNLDELAEVLQEMLQERGTNMLMA